MVALRGSQHGGLPKRVIIGAVYFVVVVLHQLPIERAFLNPGEVVFHFIPVYARGCEDVLLVYSSILRFPADSRDFLCIKIGIDEAIPVYINVDLEETFLRRVECFDRAWNETWCFGELPIEVI